MKNKIFRTIIIFLLIIYLALLLVWFALTAACFSKATQTNFDMQYCYQNELTGIMKYTHRPFFKFLIPYEYQLYF